MELFRYRNLAFGCCSFLILLFFSFYFNTTIRIATLALAGVAITVIALIYVIKRGKKSLRLLTHITPSLLFIILAMIISLTAFDKSELEVFCDGEPHNATATVTSVTYQTEYLGYYEAKLSSIDGNEISHTVKLTLSGAPVNRGDIVEINGYFSKAEHTPIGFDEASYNLSKGITVNLESDEYTLIGHKETPITDFFENANTFLDNRFKRIEDEDTYSMLSALFLGNKSNLSDNVKRDFTRIGLSHVLALSGMHITIVITIFGYALSLLKVPKIIKEIILILATLTFIGITGFSESALRAGIMVCIVYTLFFFGNRTSLISALFYSVTIICIFSPYSIFSVSLLLSFFAMLGCIISTKFIHGVTFLRKMRIKLLKFAAYTFISSVFAFLFTLPLVSVIFGSLAVLSPLTNIFLSPLFSLLIYLSPVYLLVADIPYISLGLEWLCTKITDLSLFLGERCASIDNLLVPILNKIQIAGIIVLTVFIFGLLIVKRKYCIHMAVCALCGILIFVGGCVTLYAKRTNNVYVGGFSSVDGDIIFIEDSGKLTLFDVTKTGAGEYTSSNAVSSYLGYYEIENYVITDYSTKTHLCFDNLSNATIVKNAFLPEPQNEDEESMLLKIKEIAKNKGINVSIIENELCTESTKITFAGCSTLARSEKRAVTFCIDYESTRFSYLGASSFEVRDYFAEDCAYSSDIIIFGAYGPEYKINYEYTVPYLDYCVFFGNSGDYASEAFYNEIKHKEINKDTAIARFCLTP